MPTTVAVLMAKDLSPGVSVFAPPHRRRHLQSETYKTLVRILSLCGDIDRVSLPSRPGNVESVAEKDVGDGSYNQADLARPDEDDAGCTTVPVDSLVNEQLEGAICDKNRGSSYEHSIVNGTGHVMSMDERENYSLRPVDKMVGENCVVVSEKNSEISLSAQGHTVRAEIAVFKEDPPLNFADAPLEKLTDHSDFQQTVSLSHDVISVPLQGNLNDGDIIEKRHVEDAFKGPEENEEIIHGKNTKAETQLPVGESELNVKEIFGFETGYDLPKVAGNDLAGLGGQLADVDKVTPDVVEPFDVMEEFELEDAVMDDLRMIFEDDQTLLMTDVGTTKATSMGGKNSSGIDAFSTVKQSDLRDLILDEHARADKGQEETDYCCEKASEGGGHASITANASFGTNALVEAQQSGLQKLEADAQMAVYNLQKASDNHREKINFLSLCNGPVQVSQSPEEKSLLSVTGSPLAGSEIQLNTMLGFSDGNLCFPTVKTDKEEIEEGEISDCVEGTGSPLDFSPCHENMTMDKLETVQLSECVRSVKTHNSQEQPETDGLHVDSLSSMSNNTLKGMEDATISGAGRTVLETQSVLHGKLVAEGNNYCPPVEDIKVNSVGCMKKEGGNSEADLAHGVSIGSTGTVASEKGIGIDKKRKRSCLSEQRKEKKKMQKRKKRAEKNRELGVKRLKLPPMLPPKPKPVSVCRHFLKGRCQEGGNCKFSHDAVPLTKSKPCGHFARNACMKGDECPFDHDLSKYPCNIFSSTGSCFRGNSCLFSHKVMPSDSSELTRGDGDKSKSASKLLATPSDLGLSKLAGLQGGTPGNTLVSRTPGSSDIVKQKSTGFGKTRAHEVKRSANSVERSSSISSANPSDFTPSSSRNVKGGQSSSHIIGNAIDDKQIGTSGTPLVAPKGINFLSFGVSPMDKPKPEKPISSCLALKLSALSSFLNAPKAEEPSQCVQAGARDFIPKDSAPESKSPNEIIKATPLLDVKSLGKALSNDAAVPGDASSSFAYRTLLGSSMISNKVPISTLASIQSSDFSTPSPVKATSASPPGALPSILSGNAGIKLFGGNHSISGASGETSHAISPDDAKSLRILDFLASIGKKR